MAGPPQQAPRQSRLAIHNRQRPRQAEETVPSVRVTQATSYKRVAVWAELNHLVELALQMNRHLGDARHFDLHGRHLRPPSLMEFPFLLRKGVGGIHRHREECLLEGLAKKPAGPIRHGLGVVHRAAGQKNGQPCNRHVTIRYHTISLPWYIITT